MLSNSDIFYIFLFFLPFFGCAATDNPAPLSITISSVRLSCAAPAKTWGLQAVALVRVPPSGVSARVSFSPSRCSQGQEVTQHPVSSGGPVPGQQQGGRGPLNTYCAPGPVPGRGSSLTPRLSQGQDTIPQNV